MKRRKSASKLSIPGPGRWIAVGRASLGWTPEALARRARVTPHDVRQIQRGLVDEADPRFRKVYGALVRAGIKHVYPEGPKKWLGVMWRVQPERLSPPRRGRTR